MGFLILQFMLLTFPYSCALMCCPPCLALSAEEVANVVRLMFDQPLTDRGSEVPTQFSSHNPPLEVSYCLTRYWKLHDDNLFGLMNIGGIPEVIADVVLSNDDDEEEPTRLPVVNAPTDWGPSTVDDAEGAWTTSVEATAPGPAMAGVPGTNRPSTVDWATDVLALGAHRWKHLCHAVKWSDPIHQAD
jgi:hypothetical protein